MTGLESELPITQASKFPSYETSLTVWHQQAWRKLPLKASEIQREAKARSTVFEECEVVWEDKTVEKRDCSILIGFHFTSFSSLVIFSTREGKLLPFRLKNKAFIFEVNIGDKEKKHNLLFVSIPEMKPKVTQQHPNYRKQRKIKYEKAVAATRRIQLCLWSCSTVT